jgi:hypothetical protein
MRSISRDQGAATNHKKLLQVLKIEFVTVPETKKTTGNIPEKRFTQKSLDTKKE